MKKITLRDSIRWNKESFVLFKKTPNQSLMLSLAYLFIFMLLPSMPIVQVFSIASILILDVAHPARLLVCQSWKLMDTI